MYTGGENPGGGKIRSGLGDLVTQLSRQYDESVGRAACRVREQVQFRQKGNSSGILFCKKQEILLPTCVMSHRVEEKTLKYLKGNSSIQGFSQNGAPMPKKTLMIHKCGCIWLFN